MTLLTLFTCYEEIPHHEVTAEQVNVYALLTPRPDRIRGWTTATENSRIKRNISTVTNISYLNMKLINIQRILKHI